MSGNESSQKRTSVRIMRTEVRTTNQFYCAIAQIENCAKLRRCAEFQAQLMRSV
ncbi:MAG: hypothetical protein JGK24_03985 [Microcoleus sp. PH2017_29_MFU_D_A]|uniref:hypothetical protein n=1 Tax=unclassified Microcoleus TaxID=2642155 RepID=UPI001DC79A8D|nr:MULTISPECIES: hypothetical protein [unclassified Microcoleus]MCC3465283.1 hypothetical protein [Microcoleus sp. PH2017_06_SFM_O_A]MCC3470753.1 hypothetical protein [Microcoleus sp. PH2017_13_LAR_U_A]MCC3483274.1 hypothetical protein [Microcoleus sp. PH2017_14_LAR_D_A]MCC3582828.1 hypothetical protein [Microcoleus sp. PH2017_30_WIL_O_A]MCC3596030.1 hypothetical protein [Microcoleus sp. PH2017_26_ELK_O_A]